MADIVRGIGDSREIFAELSIFDPSFLQIGYGPANNRSTRSAHQITQERNRPDSSIITHPPVIMCLPKESNLVNAIGRPIGQNNKSIFLTHSSSDPPAKQDFIVYY